MIAYIDGGVASLITQTVVVTATTALVFCRTSVKKAFLFFKGMFSKKQ